MTCFKVYPHLVFAPHQSHLRAYPSGLGDGIHKLYVEELKRPVHGDLRVIPKPQPLKSELELFSLCPIGDTWGDANLLPVWNYIYRCKHTRTLCRENQIECVVSFLVHTNGSLTTFLISDWEFKKPIMIVFRVLKLLHGSSKVIARVHVSVGPLFQ